MNITRDREIIQELNEYRIVADLLSHLSWEVENTDLIRSSLYLTKEKADENICRLAQYINNLATHNCSTKPFDHKDFVWMKTESDQQGYRIIVAKKLFQNLTKTNCLTEEEIKKARQFDKIQLTEGQSQAIANILHSNTRLFSILSIAYMGREKAYHIIRCAKVPQGTFYSVAVDEGVTADQVRAIIDILKLSL